MRGAKRAQENASTRCEARRKNTRAKIAVRYSTELFPGRVLVVAFIAQASANMKRPETNPKRLSKEHASDAALSFLSVKVSLETTMVVGNIAPECVETSIG